MFQWIRIIAVLMIPCFLADTASSAIEAIRDPLPSATFTSSSVFSEYAFNLPAGVFGHIGINHYSTAQLWKWAAIPLHRGVATVRNIRRIQASQTFRWIQ